MPIFEYLLHYLHPASMLLMLLTAAGIIIVCVSVIRLFMKDRSPAEKRSMTEQFYELIFSATTILLFVGTYFLIDFLGYGDQNPLWVQYSDFILLGFIFGSVILTSVLDKFLIPLRKIKTGTRSTMRLLGMLYMLIIFAYIKFIYQNDNYDHIIMYFLTLVIGRFVYFDASVDGFTKAISDAIRSIPLLALALGCSAAIAYVGFSSGYLLISNGVVFSLFVGHLFLLLVIFVLHWITLFVNFIEKARSSGRKNSSRELVSYGTSDGFDEESDYYYEEEDYYGEENSADYD
ncbi:MAG: hypothetical protein Q4B03_02165 [Lachnospiraceae bacterium]|nr:hypothetical protein [Lachnospiraceae bacterium]